MATQFMLKLGKYFPEKLYRATLKGKRKLGRLGDFCVPVSQSYILLFSFLIFFKWVGTNSYVQHLYLYSLTISHRKFYHKVYIFFDRRARRQTITFFTSLKFNPIFNLLKLYGSCSGVAQYMAEKREKNALQIMNVYNTATYNCFFFLQK